MNGADVLVNVISKLTRQEAAVVACTSKSFRQAFEYVQDQHEFQPCLMISCSGTSCAALIDRNLSSVRHAGSLTTTPSGVDNWSTGIAIHRGMVYTSQYQVKGVIRFHPMELCQRRGPVRVAPAQHASSPQLAAPEGLAFYRDWMYVSSIANSCITKVDVSTMRVSGRPFALPYYPEHDFKMAWAITLGPDNHLYTTVDYQPSGRYFVPPPTSDGCIVRILLDPNTGEMTSCEKFGAPPLQSLRRPSGIHFTPEGDLLVTVMEKKVLLVSGPLKPNPGVVLKSLGTEAWHPTGQPFDVVCLEAGVIFVSLHAGPEAEGAEPGCVAKVDLRTGDLMAKVMSPLLQEATMMCVFR